MKQNWVQLERKSPTIGILKVRTGSTIIMTLHQDQEVLDKIILSDVSMRINIVGIKTSNQGLVNKSKIADSKAHILSAVVNSCKDLKHIWTKPT